LLRKNPLTDLADGVRNRLSGDLSRRGILEDAAALADGEIGACFEDCEFERSHEEAAAVHIDIAADTGVSLLIRSRHTAEIEIFPGFRKEKTTKRDGNAGLPWTSNADVLAEDARTCGDERVATDNRVFYVGWDNGFDEPRHIRVD
jgi:hypothetical protein